MLSMRNCLNCKQDFTPHPDDLSFYDKMAVPVPSYCPPCRMQDRLRKRNPRKLWSRQCMKCGKGIETTYSPERPEIVYCEPCYQAEVV